jgi:hypothetical protein
MPARNSQQVRYLPDETAQPPKDQEVITRTDHALAFWHGGTYNTPDHREPQTGTWGVIELPAPADVVPVFVHYDRADSPPFRVETGDQRYTQLGDAMEAATGH